MGLATLLSLDHTINTPDARVAVNDVPGVRVVLMRQLTWVLLVAYTLLLFKPAMPVLMDAMAHTFWEQQHMLTVHEVNGKFHVHHELIQASKQTEKQKQALSAKYELSEYIPVTPFTACKVSFTTLVITSYSLHQCFYPSSSAEQDYPPPQCCFMPLSACTAA